MSDKGKWTSHKTHWIIDKSFTGTGIHINTKKQILRMNPKNSFVRFESEEIIHIYPFPTKEAVAEDPNWEELIHDEDKTK